MKRRTWSPETLLRELRRFCQERQVPADSTVDHLEAEISRAIVERAIAKAEAKHAG